VAMYAPTPIAYGAPCGRSSSSHTSLGMMSEHVRAATAAHPAAWARRRRSRRSRASSRRRWPGTRREDDLVRDPSCSLSASGSMAGLCVPAGRLALTNDAASRASTPSPATRSRGAAASGHHTTPRPPGPSSAAASVDCVRGEVTLAHPGVCKPPPRTKAGGSRSADRACLAGLIW
jgi:hypothetical protein